jgi:hypothetical protein
MSFFTTGEGYALRHLTSGYPWADIPAGTVVDLGGSHGDAAFALARAHPHLKLIVQELPEVVANSQGSRCRSWLIASSRNSQSKVRKYTCTAGRYITGRTSIA